MRRTAAQLVIVSNRLPCTVECDDGKWTARPSTGGLVTAMAPVLRNRGGMWIGWSGTCEEDGVDVDALLSRQDVQQGFSLKPVVLTQEEKLEFYQGFANEVVPFIFINFTLFLELIKYFLNIFFCHLRKTYPGM